jgi:uncharacterized protein (TIGR00369 family)
MQGLRMLLAGERCASIWRFVILNNRQPNSRHCFVCGVENPLGLHLKFYETAPGEVEAWVTLPDHYQGYPGVVHGGIVAAMLDETAGRAHMGNGDNPRFMFTAHLDVRYRKNVPTGRPIRVVGKAGLSKNRSAAASSAIYDEQGTLLAEADAILVNVPQDVIGSVDLEALGWKVYPEN